MNQDFRPPVQERSKQMLDRLLRATIKTINEVGLDGATIPRIAAETGIAPAGIYRRFKDKDSLLRAAFLKALTARGEISEQLFDKAGFSKLTLEEAAARIVSALFKQYRSAPRFLKAFQSFFENQTDSTFRASALAELRRNLGNVIEALRACPDLAIRPESELTTKFALLSVGTSIEVMVLEPDSLWTAIQPITDEECQAEFARLFVAYIRSTA